MWIAVFFRVVGFVAFLLRLNGTAIVTKPQRCAFVKTCFEQLPQLQACIRATNVRREYQWHAARRQLATATPLKQTVTDNAHLLRRKKQKKTHMQVRRNTNVHETGRMRERERRRY